VTTHLALGVEYDGSRFHGWQWQPDHPSVQKTLEDALSRIAAAPVRVAASGRTDAGVHATGQVVSFTTAAPRPDDAWLRGSNSLLPAGVAVRWVERVDESFHARFSATARRYLYVIQEQPHRPALADGFVTWSRQRLDDDAMHRAAQALVGERDFSSFRGAGCQARTPMRCIQRIRVRRFESLVVIDVTANAFLLHMVRNVAGVLLEVGVAQRPVEWVADVLALKDRRLASQTAPPGGLYLVEVYFGEHFSPPPPMAPLPLSGVRDLW
jgi:tRNA pseudouridine38-40 synthase